MISSPRLPTLAMRWPIPAGFPHHHGRDQRPQAIEPGRGARDRRRQRAASSLLFLDALAVRDKLKANPWIAGRHRHQILSGWTADRHRRALGPTHCGSRTAGFSVIRRGWRGGSSLTCRAASCCCRSWSARVPRPARARFLPRAAGPLSASERRDKGPRSSSASGAGICAIRDGLDIRLPENDVGNALATLSRPRQGRPPVLARTSPPSTCACRIA